MAALAPNSGAWVIRAVTSGTTLPTSEINTNLDFGCYVGFGLRFPWNTVETGRVNVSSVTNATTFAINTDHPTIPSGTILSFDYGTGMTGPMPATLTSSCASGSGTLVVNSTTGITAGARAGVYSDTILENGYNLAIAKGLRFKPRFMAGQWTPTHVETDGSFTYIETGGAQAGNKSHGPWIDSSGNPNLIFEKAYRQFSRHLAAWGAGKNASIANSVAEIDASNYSMEYSEMYYGPYLQAFGGSGSSAARMVTGHSRLVDINYQECWVRYGISFGHGLSGQGPLQTTVAPGISQHIATTYGSWFPGGFIQANGWGYIIGSSTVGEWGSTVESQFDANVWPIPTNRAVQDISPPSARTAGQWDEMVDDAIALDCTYVEVYSYQGVGDVPGMNATTAVHNEMLAALQRFTDFAVGVTPVSSGFALVID